VATRGQMLLEVPRFELQSSDSQADAMTIRPWQPHMVKFCQLIVLNEWAETKHKYKLQSPIFFIYAFFLSTPCDARSLLRHTRWFWSFFCGNLPGQESDPGCWDGNPASYHCNTLTPLMMKVLIWTNSFA